MLNIREPRRIIAKARHDDPTTGKRCRGARSTVITPTAGWTVAVDGADLPTSRDIAGSSLDAFEGWYFDKSTQAASYLGACPGCGKRVRMTGQLVRGRHNPTKECAPRCESATGPTCECSCSGLNHGAGHAA